MPIGNTELFLAKKFPDYPGIFFTEIQISSGTP